MRKCHNESQEGEVAIVVQEVEKFTNENAHKTYK